MMPPPLLHSLERFLPANLPRRWILVLLCGISVMISYADRTNISIAILPMKKQYNWDDVTEGTVLSSFFYGYLSTQILGGYLSYRFGGGNVLLFACFVWSLFTFLTPYVSSSMPLLILCRILLGAGEGLGFPSIHVLVAHFIPLTEQARSVSFITACSYVGAVLAVLVSKDLVQSATWGWPWVFYVFGMMGLVWCFVWSLVQESTPSPGCFLGMTKDEVDYIRLHASATSAPVPFDENERPSITRRDEIVSLGDGSQKPNTYSDYQQPISLPTPSADPSSSLNHLQLSQIESNTTDTDALLNQSSPQSFSPRVHISTPTPHSALSLPGFSKLKSSSHIALPTSSPPSSPSPPPVLEPPSLTTRFRPSEQSFDEEDRILPSYNVQQRPRRSPESSFSNIPWKRLLSSKPVWAILINQFCQSWGFYTIINWMPSYYHERFNITNMDTIGWVSIAPYLFQGAFGLLAGWVGDYLLVKRRWRVWSVRCLAQAIGMVGPGIMLLLMAMIQSRYEKDSKEPNMDGAITSMILITFALSLNAFTSIGVSMSQLDIAPKYAGIVFGMGNTASSLAGSLGVGFTGALLVWSQHDWGVVFWVMSLFCFAGFGVWVKWSSDRVVVGE